MSHNISIESGTSVKLKTAGKYCDRDIVVTATGGSGGAGVTGEFVLCGEATEVGAEAFKEYTSLTGVNLPNATTIGEYAFNYCGNVKFIRLPVATSIGEYAFSSCSYLTSVEIPSVTNIPLGAFDSCLCLESICLPAAISLETDAFWGCESLKTVDLPSATSIGTNSFYRCRKLSALILRTTETVCVCDLQSFSYTPVVQGLGHIYIPTVMYEYYRAGYEAALNAAMGTGAFDLLFRKIEDYPEICG